MTYKFGDDLIGQLAEDSYCLALLKVSGEYIKKAVHYNKATRGWIMLTWLALGGYYVAFYLAHNILLMVFMGLVFSFSFGVSVYFLVRSGQEQKKARRIIKRVEEVSKESKGKFNSQYHQEWVH